MRLSRRVLILGVAGATLLGAATATTATTGGHGSGPQGQPDRTAHQPRPPVEPPRDLQPDTERFHVEPPQAVIEHLAHGAT